MITAKEASVMSENGLQESYKAELDEFLKDFNRYLEGAISIGKKSTSVNCDINYGFFKRTINNPLIAKEVETLKLLGYQIRLGNWNNIIISW